MGGVESIPEQLPDTITQQDVVDVVGVLHFRNFAPLFVDDGTADTIMAYNKLRSLFTIPSEVERSQDCRNSMNEQVAFLMEQPEHGEWPVERKRKIAVSKKIAIEYIDEEVVKGLAIVPLLKVIAKIGSDKFRGVYIAVYNTLKFEGEAFKKFTELAAKVAAETKRDNPDFYQSANDVIPLYTQAKGVRPKFISHFEQLAQKTGGEFKAGPMKDMFRAL